MPKSQASLQKLTKVLATLPTELVDFLGSLGIDTNTKVKAFKKPSAEEVSEYSLTLGHLINGQDFVKYYQETSERFGKKDTWVDARGSEVRDWKRKLQRVWCKAENKLLEHKDAPEGYKNFFVIEKGVVVQADGWRNGKPFSKSLTSDILLKKEYERRLKGGS